MKLKDKISTARGLRISRLGFIANPMQRTTFKKIYWAYIVQCILLRKKGFKIAFKGKNAHTFSEMAKLWYRYFCRRIKHFFNIMFFMIYSSKTKKENVSKSEKYLEKICKYDSTYKPVNLKISNAPNKAVMNIFLKMNDLRISCEYTGPIENIYYISRI